MQVYPADLSDLNLCYEMDKAYSTEYVWQMHSRENERTNDIRFDQVRLPRPMQVTYPRSSDELMAHWQQQACFMVTRNMRSDLVGFVDALPQHWQSTLWIVNLVIENGHRRQGFGSLLLEATTAWAREHELGRLTLGLQTKNHPAITFVQKHGFQFCGYNERYYPNGDIALFFSRTT